MPAKLPYLFSATLISDKALKLGADELLARTVCDTVIDLQKRMKENHVELDLDTDIAVLIHVNPDRPFMIEVIARTVPASQEG